MRIDFVEAKTNSNNVLKIVLIVIIALIFITWFSIMGIHYAKVYKYSLTVKKIAEITNNKAKEEQIKAETQKNDIVLEEVKETKKEEKIKEVSLAKLPKYSQTAKSRMKNIYNESSKIAYLTFDDGPSQAVTPLILDLLKEQNIKATFFVLGSNVDNNPELVKRAYNEGHFIANHGYSHNYSKIYKNANSVLTEYNKCEKSIKKAIENEEYNSHLFRFPGGYAGGKYASVKKEAGKLLNNNDISYIDWNCLTGDAEGANTKEKIMQYIEKYTKERNNIVVLMHDAADKILTYETLLDVINYLKEEGYTFDNFYSIMQ